MDTSVVAHVLVVNVTVLCHTLSSFRDFDHSDTIVRIRSVWKRHILFVLHKIPNVPRLPAGPQPWLV